MATNPVKSTKKYNSNPFTLAFEALSTLFKTNPIWAIVITIFSAGGLYVQVFNTNESSFSFESAAAGDSFSIALLVSTIIIALLVIPVAFAVGTFIQGMVSHVVNKSRQGKSVSFSEAFSATKSRFWRLFWAEALATVKILAWSLLLIIPGIVAAMRYSVLSYLIMDESDKEKGIVDSHNKTKTLIKGRLWEAFGITTVSGIVPIFGGILGSAGKGFLYAQLKDSHAHNSKKPKVHVLNYLGLWIAGALFFVLLLALIVGIALGINS